MENRVGRHHVGATQPEGDAVAGDGFNLTAAARRFAFGEGIAIHNALSNGHHGLTGGAQGGGVLRTFHDHPAHRLSFGGFRQLSETSLLAENLRGGDHITSLHRDAVFHLQLGVGGAMAGIRHGVATHQDRLEDHQTQTGNGLGALVRCLLDIHRHLRRGVEGFKDQLRLEQLDPFDGFDQLVVLKGKTLGCLDAEVRTIGLLDVGELGQLGLIRNGVFLNRTQQQTLAFGRFNGLHVLHLLAGETFGDLLTGIHHLTITLETFESLGIGAEVELTAANDDFPEDVVLLGDRDDAGGLTEDVLHHLGAGLDPLTIGDHQQGDVLVDLVGFLGDPQQGATLVDLVAVLG